MRPSAREKTREALKTALIFALIILAAYLTYETWFFAVPANRRFFGKETPLPTAYTEYAEYEYAAQAMTPLRGAVRSGGMLASGNADAVYGATERDSIRALYSRLLPTVLAEALGSAYDLREITRTDWDAALAREMVFFDFEGQVPLYALAAGTDASALDAPDASARFLALTSSSDGTVLLYYSNATRYFECRTSAEAYRLAELISGYEPNGATLGPDGTPAEFLCFENTLPPPALDMYIMTGTDTAADADRVTNALLRALSLNPYTIASYTEPDGTRVYVEGQNTLRMQANGHAVFSVTQTDTVENAIVSAAGDAAERAMLLGRAGRLAELALAPWLGDAQTYLVRAYTDEESGNFIVLFGCQVGGVPILRDEGYFMRVEFSRGTLVSADLHLASFRSSGNGAVLMPWRQAYAAASQSLPVLRMLGLYYRLGGSRPLFAEWLRLS